MQSQIDPSTVEGKWLSSINSIFLLCYYYYYFIQQHVFDVFIMDIIYMMCRRYCKEVHLQYGQ